MARLAWTFAAVMAAVGVLGANPSAAQEDDARMHFRLGRAYYDSGRFAEAAAEFEKAAEMSNRPQLYYNIFLAYRDAGDLANAIRALEIYLERVPDAAERPQLEARLASMRRLQEQTGGTGDPADVNPDPNPDPEGGEGDPDATSDGDPDPDGSATLVDPDGAATSTPTDPDGESGGTWMPGWIIAGAGGAVAVAGVVTGIMALGRQSDLEDRCVMDGDRFLCDDDALADADGGKTLALTTDILLIAGGATLVTGVVLALIMGGDADEDDPTVAVAADRHGASFTIRGQF